MPTAELPRSRPAPTEGEEVEALDPPIAPGADGRRIPNKEMAMEPLFVAATMASGLVPVEEVGDATPQDHKLESEGRSNETDC
jgi:hypothetical protein